MNTSQVLIKLPPNLKNKVKSIAQKEGKNFSLIVRELLENYVKEKDMESYIDELWLKIGKELDPLKKDKIDEIIHIVRKEKNNKSSY